MRIVYFNKLKYSNISKSLPTISVKKGMIIDRTFALLILVTLNISIILNLSHLFIAYSRRFKTLLKFPVGKTSLYEIRGFIRYKED